MGLDSTTDIPIPLRGLWDYYYKHVPSEPTPDPSQTPGWDAEANETHNKVAPRRGVEDTKVIGKDTQESLDAIDEITGKMENRRQKMRKEEEKRAAKIRKELEDRVRKQREGIEEEGKKIWDRIKIPSPPKASPPPPACLPSTQGLLGTGTRQTYGDIPRRPTYGGGITTNLDNANGDYPRRETRRGRVQTLHPDGHA